MEFSTRRFAENGYHPTSVAEIVQGLGVGKGVFYWYFRSKEELFLEILHDAQRQLRRRQQIAIGDEPDPVKRIGSFGYAGTPSRMESFLIIASGPAQSCKNFTHSPLVVRIFKKISLEPWELAKSRSWCTGM